MSPKGTDGVLEVESLDKLQAHLGNLFGDQPEGKDSLELAFVRALLETAQVVVLVLAQDRSILYFNRYFEKLTGFTLDELEGKDWFETCIRDRDAIGVLSVFDAAIGGTPTSRNANPIRTRSGDIRIVEWWDRPIRDEHGEFRAVLCVGNDVTARSHALRDLEMLNEELEARVTDRTALLEEKTQLLEGSFDASTVALAYLDPDMRFMRVNKAYAAADGKTPDDFIGKNHFDIYPDEDNEKLFYGVRDSGKAHSFLAKPFEYAANPERGVTHWDWTLTPVLDESSVVTGLVLALRDVTKRIHAIEAVKKSEALLATKLSEKEVLLREIHHRVKNNLQVVSSLLYLQASKLGDKEITRLFDESRNRVHAMALVHETLYSSDDIGAVDFGDYLRRLVPAISFSFAATELEVEFTISSTAGPLGLDAAIPCGLIACELVTNALKYAFEGRTHGKISMSLDRGEGNTLCLLVRDDGIGISTEEIETSKTLGMVLVKSLAHQLEGNLEASSDGGTEFRVVFPANESSNFESGSEPSL